MATLVIAFLLSIGAGFWFGELEQETAALNGWIGSVGCAMVLACLFLFLGRKAQQKMFRKEALCVIGLGWILASLIGAIPYILILPDCSIATAVFESTSGLTTTGASAFEKFENLPKSLLFWRCLSQWIGGLGVVVFFVAILSFLGAGAKILFSNESSGHSTQIETGRIQDGVFKILLLYLGLSGLCLIAFKACGMNVYDAICHMFATVSTGGFSTYEASIAAFNSPLIEWVTILFMALGGTSFFVMLKVLRGNWRAFTQNTEVIAYFLTILIASLIMSELVALHNQDNQWHDAIRAATFQVVSIITTTGFGTANFEDWQPASKLIILCLMFLGGCSGSTAGGSKIIRFVVVIKMIAVNIERSFRSRVVRHIHINGKSIDRTDLDNTITYMLLLGIITFFSLPAIALLQGDLSIESTLGAMLGTLYNVGPGLGAVGPAHNYAFLHDSTKYFLSLLMIMGRLELYAILVLFAPSLWRRFS